MNAKSVSLGLGLFSLALGAAELFASRIADRLSVPGGSGTVKAYGVRELVAGVGLLQAPAHSARVWNRVAGDLLDLGTLAVSARRSPKERAVWGAIGFVVFATALDLLTARALDRTTGKTMPVGA
ncbi:hypothetical protein [Sphingomonas sp. GM_Shp_1]|uniref:hypothetical protein n=1 Tax=Sphingomonas sp. GM_Shp_1 TaxID=2937381 RepID=UPI00226BAE34|nr:hypothetical protein [Sphingomonas sp. GM_Shp_1]